MLLLTFCIGPTRFVIDALRVSQVVPRVPLRALPLCEPYVAGLLDFRGTVMAVVDLSTRLFGTPCASRLSTRIIIVRLKHEDRELPLGLIAEQVTKLCRTDEPVTGGRTLLISKNVVPEHSVPANEVREHDCLGRIVRVDGALAQWIEVDRLLSESMRNRIFDQILE